MDDALRHAQTIAYQDAWLVGGARTPFADCNGTLDKVSATDLGVLAGEVIPVTGERLEREGSATRASRLPRKVNALEQDEHPRPTPPTPVMPVMPLPPAFGGVHTGGNSSGMVDGAAAVVAASGDSFT